MALCSINKELAIPKVLISSSSCNLLCHVINTTLYFGPVTSNLLDKQRIDKCCLQLFLFKSADDTST